MLLFIYTSVEDALTYEVHVQDTVNQVAVEFGEHVLSVSIQDNDSYTHETSCEEKVQVTFHEL